MSLNGMSFTTIKKLLLYFASRNNMNYITTLIRDWCFLLMFSSITLFFTNYFYFFYVDKVVLIEIVFLTHMKCLCRNTCLCSDVEHNTELFSDLSVTFSLNYCFRCLTSINIM